LGGHRVEGFGTNVSVGGVVSEMTTTTVSRALVATSVMGSVWVTVSVTVVDPRGRSTLGVGLVSSLKAIPVACQRNVVSEFRAALAPSTVDPRPSRVTDEPGLAEHSRFKSSPASATTWAIAGMAAKVVKHKTEADRTSTLERLIRSICIPPALLHALRIEGSWKTMP